MSKAQKITFGAANTLNVAVPLFSFDSLFDSDVGLIKLIDMGYASEEYFDIDFFKQYDNNRSIVNILYKRKEVNPLLLCLKNKDHADLLYKKFFEEKYVDILKLSVFTGVFYLLLATLEMDDIRPSIVYKSDIEADFLSIIDPISTVPKIDIRELVEDKKKIFNYKQFYFKRTDDIYINSILPSLIENSIYFLDYGFNVDEEHKLIINKNTEQLQLQFNSLLIINAFDNDRLVEKEDNNEQNT